MADQTLAQSRALKEPFAQKPRQEYTLLYKLTWRWRAICCWARYMLVGSRRGVPGLVDFVVGNFIFGAAQVPSELTALGEILAPRRPECALEIGTCNGGTLLFLTRLASPQATIVSVDLPGGRFGGGYGSRRRWFYQRFARHGQRLHLLQGDSHSADMLNRAKAALRGQPLDYLFIDGDHTYEGVKQDFELYAPLVRKGGIIAFHDIAEHSPAIGCEVSQFWNRIKRQYRHTEIIEDRKQGWAGIGVLYVD
ncbi:MAG TPA: class I SAM-dependent methyltransferase [Terriglobia bacterium]|nr:class I SAM-dependent methyltransferase [Terriglobia bacterium]